MSGDPSGGETSRGSGGLLPRKSLAFLLARGSPGVLNLVAIGVFTRTLGAADYGVYAIVMSVAWLLNVALFQWLRHAAVRYSHGMESGLLSSGVAAGGVFAVAVLGMLCAGAALVAPPEWRIYAGIVFPLVVAMAVADFHLELARLRLASVRYGSAMVAHSATFLLVGWILAGRGELGATGVLCGYAIGATVSTGISSSGSEWRWSRPAFTEATVGKIARFGLPLTGSAVMWALINSADRFMLGAFVGVSVAGVYASVFDLTKSTIILVILGVHLPAYPLLLRAWEEGRARTLEVARETGAVLMAVGIPVLVGLIVLSGPITTLALGSEFADQIGVALVALIGLSALVAGIRAYYFDLVFALSEQTTIQLYVVASALGLNLILNLVLIPPFGMMGCAVATLASFLLALARSIQLGRRLLPFPFPVRGFLTSLVAAGGMAVVLIPIVPEEPSTLRLAASIGAGAVVYLLIAARTGAVDLAALRGS